MLSTNLLNIASRLGIALVLCLLWPAGAVYGKDYEVEIVLFEHVNGGADVSTGLSYPKLGRAIGLNSEAAPCQCWQSVECVHSRIGIG